MSSIYSLHTRSQFYSTVGEGLILQSNGVSLSKYCMSPWYKSCIDLNPQSQPSRHSFHPEIESPENPISTSVWTSDAKSIDPTTCPHRLRSRTPPWSLYLSPDLEIVPLFFSRSLLGFSCSLPAYTMTTATSVFPPLESRPLKDTIVLFDVDETLTKARRVCDTIVPASINDANSNWGIDRHTGDA